jgi:hypothetical protein
MKVALCLSGQVRCFKQTYPSIKEHLIDPLNADVYISVWHYTLPDDRNAEDGDIEQCINLYKPVAAQAKPFGQEEHAAFTNSPFRNHGAEGVQVDRVLAMWTRINAAFAMSFETHYDLYIRCRFDLRFNNGISRPEILSVLDQPQVIGIPFSRDYDTIRNDQFAFGSFEAMTMYCMAPISLVELCKRGFKIHPERLLFEHLKRNGIETFPSSVNYRVLRPNGEENPCVD